MLSQFKFPVICGNFLMTLAAIYVELRYACKWRATDMNLEDWG